MQELADAAHAVVQETKDAGVRVFGGGMDESIPPVRVDGDGLVSQDTYPQTAQIEGGYTVLELPTYDAALQWAAKIAAACRCAQEVRAFQYEQDGRVLMKLGKIPGEYVGTGHAPVINVWALWGQNPHPRIRWSHLFLASRPRRCREGEERWAGRLNP